MKKILGLSWLEWVCIFVAVCTADIVTDYFHLTGFTNFIVWIIAWSAGYFVAYIIIKKILEWKEKN